MSVSTLEPIQEILHRWILAGQALVGSVGALAFIAAFAARIKTPYVGEALHQASSPWRTFTRSSPRARGS